MDWGTRGWKFVAFKDWTIASNDVWVEGKRNEADGVIKELKRTMIVSRTNEYGGGIEMETKMGFELLDRIRGDVTLDHPAEKKS